LSDKKINKDEYMANVLELGQVDGKQYALIRDASTQMIGYNKDMFDAAGVPYPKDDWTWDDFLGAAQKLTKVENGKNMLRTFIDSTKRYTRISVQMADVGTAEMNAIEASLRPRIDSIFNPEKYTVTMTGNSIVYTKGTEFLIGNLWESVLLGILFISVIIALVFRSSRMVIIAILCNLIPLLCTAAVMGFGHIPVKPSTLIVFSVALGIAIDNAILFLAKYKSELFFTGGNVKEAVAFALDEAGISMIYTSIVLVIGFGVFLVSGFGATQALGMLISLTLFVALFFNIIVLPSLIMTFKKV